ncbi:MAG: hypothetical protein WC055_01070 [Melioribacteraceae bacterium]
MNDNEMFKIMDGMNQVNIEMANKIHESSPICHFRKMDFEQSDSVDGYYTNWWECSFCGHTKESK